MKKKTDKTEALNTQELFHDPSEQALDMQEWAFNRGATIQRLVAISKTRAERHTTNHAIHDEDRIPERVIKNPLPHNPYVDFFDNTDFALSELGRFCDRLAVRRKTLEFHRVKVASADWSSEQKQEIALIDEALELIDYALGNPTALSAALEKRIEHYENFRSGTSHKSAEEHLADKAHSVNNPVFAPPQRKNDIATLMCDKGNKFFLQNSFIPSPDQLRRFIIADTKKSDGISVSQKRLSDLIVEGKEIDHRNFKRRYDSYLKQAKPD